jgi:hypothetical protein
MHVTAIRAPFPRSMLVSIRLGESSDMRRTRKPNRRGTRRKPPGRGYSGGFDYARTPDRIQEAVKPPASCDAIVMSAVYILAVEEQISTFY